jgi:hypothetical protein
MEGYVLIAVPTQLVPAVTEFIGRQSSGGGPSVREAAVARVLEKDGDVINGWDQSLIERAYNESADPMRSLLRFLAAHADREVSPDEIAEGIGVKDWNSVAGMLGAFGRRSTNRYRREFFPWETRWDDGKTRIKMPSSVARIIDSLAQ